MQKTYLVAINALSGGGKTTVTQRLKETLDNVDALYFDDRDYDSDSDIVDICKWMDDGADANQFNLDLLEEDIRQLLVKGLDIILLDYPFGYRHDKIAKYIDLSIFIDTPLDIALGRRLLRDYKCISDQKVFEDLEFYLSRGRQTYLLSRNIALEDADIIVDGSKSITEIIDFIKVKLFEVITDMEVIKEMEVITDMKEKMDLKKADCNMGMEKYRSNINTKQFQILTDINLIWDFMVEIYGRNFTNGVAAPFYEYAITSTWMDISYQYLNRIWFDGDKIVAFVFTESPVTNIFFNLRPGYEELVEELLDYAEEHMPNFDNQRQFILFNGQDSLMNAVAKRGYRKVYEEHDFIFDFQNELAYKLPEGFHFVKESEVDPIKLARCCWKGFDHEQDKGPFEKWEEADCGTSWNPQKSYNGVRKGMICPAPHATPQFDIVIANEDNEYVCYSGMWWVKENNLAYMEPLCTIPEYRSRGLAAAALSKHYERMKKLGATHMTGGGNDFYKKIGYSDGIVWTHWKKT